jgi:hypothetical protein
MRSLVVALVLAATAPVGAGQPVGAAARASQPAARQAEAQPSWTKLTPSQQVALMPLRQRWSQLDAARKAKWLVVAQRFAALPPDERQRLQARMAAWAAMTPTERGRARQSFQELRNLPHEDRQALWEAYRALPEEQKQRLAQRARPAPRVPEPASAPNAKRIVAVNPTPAVVKPVSPTVVQAKPGVTTTLVSKAPNPPSHHQAGLPKIMATEGFVNPSTLLPSRGPQGAAAIAAPASSASSSRR